MVPVPIKPWHRHSQLTTKINENWKEKMSDIELEKIKTLQESQKNIKVTIGSAMGLILIIFFFTFAMLVDKFPPVFFVIESIITLIFIPSFFLLNKISFTILKIKKGKNEEYKPLMEKLKPSDVDKKPEAVLSSIG